MQKAHPTRVRTIVETVVEDCEASGDLVGDRIRAMLEAADALSKAGLGDSDQYHELTEAVEIIESRNRIGRG